jgi:hypothetical protein
MAGELPVWRDCLGRSLKNEQAARQLGVKSSVLRDCWVYLSDDRAKILNPQDPQLTGVFATPKISG